VHFVGFLYKNTVITSSLKSTVLQNTLIIHRLTSIVNTFYYSDAHYYKSVEKLIGFKSYNTCPNMFRFTQKPSSEISPVFGQNCRYFFLCSSIWTRSMLWRNIDEHRKNNNICSFGQAQDCSLMMFPV
jgi:hypothetical protein